MGDALPTRQEQPTTKPRAGKALPANEKTTPSMTRALETVTLAKYLGVTLQSNLWQERHIDNICAKANRMLGFLRRNLKVASTKIKLSYKAMVHPLIKYANTVWEPHCSKHISSIEDVQGRAARFVLNGHRSSSSVEDMLHQLKMKLPSLRTPMLNRPAHHVLQLKYPLDKHKCGTQT